MTNAEKMLRSSSNPAAWLAAGAVSGRGAIKAMDVVRARREKAALDRLLAPIADPDPLGCNTGRYRHHGSCLDGGAMKKGWKECPRCGGPRVRCRYIPNAGPGIQHRPGCALANRRRDR